MQDASVEFPMDAKCIREILSLIFSDKKVSSIMFFSDSLSDKHQYVSRSERSMKIKTRFTRISQ